MDLWKYYGVDWALFFLIVLHLWMLGNKWRAAWIVGVGISICSILFGYLSESVALVLMNVVFIFFHIWNYVKWGEQDASGRIQRDE